MNTQRTTAKKLTALAVLPLAAALTLSACISDEESNTHNDASNVNIEPVDTPVHEKETTVDDSNADMP